jgi:hypothetical protein
MPLSPIGCPDATPHCQPCENFYFWWFPTLPDPGSSFHADATDVRLFISKVAHFRVEVERRQQGRTLQGDMAKSHRLGTLRSPQGAEHAGHCCHPRGRRGPARRHFLAPWRGWCFARSTSLGRSLGAVTTAMATRPLAYP